MRTATQPTSTGFELVKFQEAQKHRFLAYTFPSRSPDPAHPAVLGRPDFVAAAPTHPGVPRLRLPPTSPHRYDGKETKVFHLHSNNQRLVAHHTESDTLASSREPLIIKRFAAQLASGHL